MAVSIPAWTYVVRSPAPDALYMRNFRFMIENKLGQAPLATPALTEKPSVIITINPDALPPPDEAGRTISLYTSALPGGDISLSRTVLLQSFMLVRQGLPPKDRRHLVHTLPSSVTPARIHAAAQNMDPAWRAKLTKNGPITALLMGPFSDSLWDQDLVRGHIKRVLDARRQETILLIPTKTTTEKDQLALLELVPNGLDWLQGVPADGDALLTGFGLADELIVPGNDVTLLSDAVACTQKDTSLSQQKVPSLRIIYDQPLDTVARQGSFLAFAPNWTNKVSTFIKPRDQGPFHTTALSSLWNLMEVWPGRRLSENLRRAKIAGPFSPTHMKRPVHILSGWESALDMLAHKTRLIVAGQNPYPETAPLPTPETALGRIPHGPQQSACL